MKSIRVNHYTKAIVFSSIFCGIMLHGPSGIFPLFLVGSAVILVFPVLRPFMAYQENIYPTPAVVDFPILLVLYPIYFALLFSPILVIAILNERKKPEQGTGGNAF